MAELEENVRRYVRGMSASPEIRVTYCDRNGAALENADPKLYHAAERGNTVKYLQGARDFAAEIRPSGMVIELTTRNPAFKLPDGSGVGDSMEKLLASSPIPGDYRRGSKKRAVSHMWSGDGIMTTITERGSKIAEIRFFNSASISGVSFNHDYARFFIPGEDGDPAGGVAWAGLPPADSELNDSTDANLIKYYPLTRKERTWLATRHRGALNLYSQKKYDDAYAAFSKLADDYDGCDYLAAYWAGVTAGKLKRGGEAAAWFRRAVEVNPNYRPALAELPGEKAPPAGPHYGGDFSSNGYTHRRDWGKLLSAGDLALAEKIYDTLTTFGATEEDVVQRLGNPSNMFSQGWYDGVHKFYRYGGRKSGDKGDAWNDAPLGLEFLTGNGESYVITARTEGAGEFRLKHVNVGDSIESVKKIFGSNIYYEDEEHLTYSARLRDVSDAGTAFEAIELTLYFDANKKIRIVVVTHVDSASDINGHEDDD
jgi:tetratricopeptide (TPR) repeat protein